MYNVTPAINKPCHKQKNDAQQQHQQQLLQQHKRAPAPFSPSAGKTQLFILEKKRCRYQEKDE